jgi:hypothetical protein
MAPYACVLATHYDRPRCTLPMANPAHVAALSDRDPVQHVCTATGGVHAGAGGTRSSSHAAGKPHQSVL